MNSYIGMAQSMDDFGNAIFAETISKRAMAQFILFIVDSIVWDNYYV